MTHTFAVSKPPRQEKNTNSTPAFYMMLICMSILYEFGYCLSAQLLKMLAHTHASNTVDYDLTFKKNNKYFFIKDWELHPADKLSIIKP
jgi:hypothetical protein